MKKKVLILVSVGLVAVLVIVALIMGLVVGPNMEREALLSKYPDRGVARINIELNGVSLDEIKAGTKDDKYEGNKLTIIGEDESQDEGLAQNGGKERGRERRNKRVVGERDDVWEFGDVQVKGRGNGTWVQDKKPYQIKFKDKVDLFGMGKARKWVLLANAIDTTNLRIDTAFYLGRTLGMEYAFDGEFVELYFNGEYEGLYYLTHAVEINKSSVNLKDPMGILVELDNVYGWMEDYFETDNGDKLIVKDVLKEDNRDIAMKEFLNKYNQLETAISKKNYKTICKLADVESFAKYYLLSEFTVNPDAYWTSFYMYKDGEDDKIHAGPGWDFDLAFANKAWGNWMGEEFYSPTMTMARKNEIMTKEMYDELDLSAVSEVDWYGVSLSLSQIVFDLIEVEEFRDVVDQVYMSTMYGRNDELMRWIRDKAEEIKDAAFADEQKWGKEGFSDETNTVKDWIEERYKYFDHVYGKEEL